MASQIPVPTAASPSTPTSTTSHEIGFSLAYWAKYWSPTFQTFVGLP
jgi:hypothetical protein